MQEFDRAIEILRTFGDLDLRGDKDQLTIDNPAILRNIKFCRVWPKNVVMKTYLTMQPIPRLRFEVESFQFTGPDVDELQQEFQKRRRMGIVVSTNWTEHDGLHRVIFRTYAPLHKSVAEIHHRLHSLIFDFNAFTSAFADWQETDAEHIEDDEEPEIEEPEIEEQEETPVPTNTKPRDIYSDIQLGPIHKADPHKAAEQVIAELDKLIGLASVKDLVRKLAAQREIASARKQAGLRAVVPSPHLVFTGNPGTGKTTVARFIGQLYKSLGLLTKGHVIEADRSTLVSGYIGQSALKTKAVCTGALGGVLFIDEAYGLNNGSSSNYGAEAVEALLTFMEEHRGDFVVVVAGYPEKMSDFMDMNPGLRSRFDLTLEFPDYTNQELLIMFHKLVRDNDYRLDAFAQLAVKRLIGSWQRKEGFGNGRDVRTLFNQVVANHSLTLAGKASLSRADLMLIRRDAIPVAPPVTPKRAPSKREDFVLGYL